MAALDRVPAPEESPRPASNNLRFRWLQAVAASELPPTARLLAHTLALHMKGDGSSCFPSLARLARESGINRRTVARHLVLLEDAGWLQRQRERRPRGDFTTTTYTPTMPVRVVAQNHHPVVAHNHQVVAESHQGSGCTPPKTVRETDSKTRAAAKGGWPAQASAIWKLKMGGPMAPGQLARTLKPVVDEHGEAAVLAAWDTYLSVENPKYASPTQFVQKFAHWRDYKPTTKGHHLAEVDSADIAAWNGSS